MSFHNIEEIKDALQTEKLSTRHLHEIWEQRQPLPDTSKKKHEPADRHHVRHIAWMQQDIGLVRRFIARALEKEEFLLVSDAAQEILRLWETATPKERSELIRVRIDYASALLRLGFTAAARRELTPMLAEDFSPHLAAELRVDIALRLGDVIREEWHQTTARVVRQQLGEEMVATYQSALREAPERLDALLLVSASSLVLGTPGSALWADAQVKARHVLTLAGKREHGHGPTLETGEARALAHAILQDLDKATEGFAALKGIEGITTPQLAEARYRTQFIAEALGLGRDYFKRSFPPLQLVVFSGHLPDRPGSSAPPRFPPEMIEAVGRHLDAKLAEADVRVALCSAAAGADLLFIEAMRKRDGLLHVVLPWAQEEFRHTSVAAFDSPRQPRFWEARFDTALQEAETVRELGQQYEPSSAVGWSYCTEVTAGLALHAARVGRLDVQPMALWDGLPGRGPGGTESFVEFWRQQLRQEPVLLQMPQENISVQRQEIQSQRCEQAILQQQVKSMLFADIVGYSKLTEPVIPEFVATFLERVSQIAASTKSTPRSINTWGDAVYAVFDFAHEAGNFALEIAQMIREGEEEWFAKGLYWAEPGGAGQPPVRHPLNIRIGLHTGPVFIHYDPIVRRLGFTGAHVNRAARIEPVTKPGEVYASEEFAALAELDAEMHRRGISERPNEQGGFLCEYAGTMPLAKNYPGRFRIYRVLPHRVLALEELAEMTHQLYCDEARARGETRAVNPALRPWSDLPENFKNANRAQVADIPNKLQQLGYELSPGHGLRPSEMTVSDAQVEALAIREHDRWAKDRERSGWKYAPTRNNSRKLHPLLIPWEKLSETEREKDRDTVRNLPRLIEAAGFRVRKIA